jgi:hypothetical protein
MWPMNVECTHTASCPINWGEFLYRLCDYKFLKSDFVAWSLREKTMSNLNADNHIYLRSYICNNYLLLIMLTTLSSVDVWRLIERERRGSPGMWQVNWGGLPTAFNTNPDSIFYCDLFRPHQSAPNQHSRHKSMALQPLSVGRYILLIIFHTTNTEEIFCIEISTRRI